ncbi:unnamed protein product [Adineta ricciae]|nr:unnamed protein product [Adineta ricciae]
MSEKHYILDISDERHDDQRHQHYVHALRAKKSRFQTERQYRLYSPERARPITRLGKAKELIEDEDADEERFSYEPYESIDIWDFAYRRCRYEFSISYAIRLKDADFLEVLLRQLKLNYENDFHPKVKDNFGRRRTRHRRRITRSETMLTDAIKNADSRCVETILDGVYDGFIYSTIVDHVCANGRTALWHACRKGDFNFVRELVERAHANVNRCGVLLVAIQNNHEEIVNYLLQQGCDPNRRVKNYNESALHIASRRNRLAIVKLLLKYGAEVNVLDYKKRTPLDYAVHKRYVDIARILIEHHNGRFIMGQAGFTPLMLAAYCDNKPIVQLLVNILPDQQVLDELLLLASRYTIDGNLSKRDEAYCYFERALSRAAPACINPSCEAYEYLTECQTLDELVSIRNDDNKLRMYALVVSERLLLQKGELKHLLTLIMKQSDVYRWQRLFRRCLQLRMHAYQLLLQAEDHRKYDEKVQKSYLFQIVSSLYKILETEKRIPVHSLARIWSWILDEFNRSLNDVLIKLLMIVFYLLETNNINGNEKYILVGLLVRLIRKNIFIKQQYSPLRYFINQAVSDVNELTCASASLPALSIIRWLIYAGADVNETDSHSKMTLLHYIVQPYNIDKARPILQILLDADAHIDCVNAYGRSPEDYVDDREVKEILRAHRKISLKCLCAHLIVSSKISYKHCRSPKLVHFVNIHSDDNGGSRVFKKPNASSNEWTMELEW